MLAVFGLLLIHTLLVQGTENNNDAVVAGVVDLNDAANIISLENFNVLSDQSLGDLEEDRLKIRLLSKGVRNLPSVEDAEAAGGMDDPNLS